jgi:murein L,D-transpeptidase YcbB/YkuD
MLLRALRTVLLGSVLAGPAVWGNSSFSDDASLANSPPLQALYRAHRGENLWVESGRPRPIARAALEMLSQAHAHGLRAADYRVDLLYAWHEGLSQGAPEWSDDFELALSAALMQFVADMRPADFEGQSRETRAEALAQRVLDAVAADDLGSLYASLAPRHEQYIRLQALLAEYERLAAGPQGISIGAGPKLERGASGPRVASLRMRLLGAADTAYGESERSYFDDVLEAAVKRYQGLHGLEADGVVGPQTQRHMDTSLEEKIALIKLNLARWRRLPVDLGRDYVLVNIPEYRLDMVRGREPNLSMRVVVGSKSNQTPEFNDAIEYLVFNPYWYVPNSIWVKELLPKAVKNPSYLEANGYELLDAAGTVLPAAAVDWAQAAANRGKGMRVRQRPGANNSLGAVKFLFPNPLDIYLHDSPARGLYAHTARAFSHGCIRLESPELLAQALLEAHADWDSDGVRSAMSRGRQRQVNLTEPVPVYLAYLSVKVMDDGQAAFFADVYGRDRRGLAQYM